MPLLSKLISSWPTAILWYLCNEWRFDISGKLLTKLTFLWNSRTCSRYRNETTGGELFGKPSQKCLLWTVKC